MTADHIPVATPQLIPATIAHYLRSHKSELVERIASELQKTIELYRRMDITDIHASVDAALAPYLSAIEIRDAQPLHQWLTMVLQVEVVRTISMDMLYQTTSVYRAALFDMGLQALSEGITDALDGIRTISNLVDQVLLAITNVYQNQITLFRTLTDYAPDGIGVADTSGKITYVNPAFHMLMGYGPELLGMSVSELLAPEGMQYLPMIREGMTEHGVWRGELQYQRKDGKQFTGDLSSYVLHDATNHQIANVAILRDLTQQQERDRELRNFQSLVESSSDGITILDFNETITYSNSAFRNIIHSKECVVGQSFESFYAPENTTTLETIRQQVRTNGSWQGRLVHRCENGDRVMCLVAISLMHNHRGEPIGSTTSSRDITEQVRAEAEREMLQEQVIVAQRAALAELSTPLIPINDRVMVMPLIGSIDSGRAQQIIERLLNGITQSHAETAIIDITGVPVVDTQVAQALLRAAQAAGLIGANVVLTGIRPEVAQTLVGLGISLQSIATHSTLQSGIAYALRRTSFAA